MTLHSNYTPDRQRVQKTCTGPSLTQQNFKEDCDINMVMRRFAKTGVLSHENPAKPGYGDFSGFEDYHSSMNKILMAQDAFMTVNAEIRARFHNDPGEFLEFTTNADNAEEMVEMGLAERSQEPLEAPPGEAEPQPKADPPPPPADTSKGLPGDPEA